MAQAASSDPLTIVVSLVVLFFVLRYLFGGSPAPATSPNQNRRGERTDSRADAGGGAARRRRIVDPAKVDAVLAMFPDYPRATIERDLARTDSVEQTLDNILSGALVCGSLSDLM
ncbi:hypothetical protein HDU83_001726 [Entophlyctis luteolus]|nr:hypothetical protein HDU83_001726 [Entophlyctis luteolus]